MLAQTPEGDRSAVVAEILPSQDQWARAFAAFLSKSPNPSLALTTAFGGAVGLIVEGHQSDAAIQYDDYGQSLAYRLFRYMIDLFDSGNMLDLVFDKQRTDLIVNLALFLQLAGDNVSVEGCMPLWDSSERFTDRDVIDFIAKAQSAFASWMYEAPTSEVTIMVQKRLLEASSGSSPSSYYHGRAYSSLTVELVEKHGQLQDPQNHALSNLAKVVDIFPAIALLSSLPEGRHLTRFCNELLASLTGGNFEADSERSLRLFVLLNCTLQHTEGLIEEIPQQRLVFFVKHAVDMLETVPTTARTEVLKTLNLVLSPIKEIYGSFWESLFGILEKTFEEPGTDENLAVLAASLRLLSLLHKQDMQDGNDDLLDSWTDKRASIAKKLVDLAGKLKGPYPMSPIHLMMASSIY